MDSEASESGTTLGTEDAPGISSSTALRANRNRSAHESSAAMILPPRFAVSGLMSDMAILRQQPFEIPPTLRLSLTCLPFRHSMLAHDR
jgi:hypothetical protein